MIAKQTDVSSCQNVMEVLEHANLNFIPVQSELMTLDGVNITGFKGIYRSDTKDTLSVMGEDYTAFPPAQTFAVADALKDQYGLQYRRAVGVDGGKRIVIEMESPKEILLGGQNGERATRRIRIMDSLDGTSRFTASVGIWRMVCTNGLFGWAYEQAVSIRHTKHAQDRLKEAMRIWAIAGNAFEQIEAQAESLMRKIVTREQVTAFLDTIIGKVDDKASTRKKNQRADVEHLFLHGRGNHGQTAWDLVNAVTEYYQHEVNPNNPESRLASSIFGQGKSQADKAVKLALSI